MNPSADDHQLYRYGIDMTLIFDRRDNIRKQWWNWVNGWMYVGEGIGQEAYVRLSHISNNRYGEHVLKYKPTITILAKNMNKEMVFAFEQSMMQNLYPDVPLVNTKMALQRPGNYTDGLRMTNADIGISWDAFLEDRREVYKDNLWDFDVVE